MDLKDFVAGSLTQITQGIREAQKHAAESGAWINPAGSGLQIKKDTTRLSTPDGLAYLEEVRFDVAVTVSDEQGAKAGAGLKIFGAKLGAEGNVTYQNAAVSRVQFSVPVVWPGQTQPELEKQLAERRQQREAELRSEQARARQLSEGSGSSEDWMAR